MSIFVLQRIQTSTGRLSFYTLNKCVHCPFDRICGAKDKQEAVRKYDCMLSEWDAFEDSLSKTNVVFRKQLIRVYSMLDSLVNLQTLPHTKFKDITPAKERVKEYELKTEDLRVYMFHIERTGRVIVLGGIKGTQEADIKRFRNLKHAYLNAINADKP
jgi:putative component of toxin-antitoxin plasmid stabilization module